MFTLAAHIGRCWSFLAAGTNYLYNRARIYLSIGNACVFKSLKVHRIPLHVHGKNV